MEGNGNRMLILERQHSMWAEAPVNKRNRHLIPIFQQPSSPVVVCSIMTKMVGETSRRKQLCVNRWLVSSSSCDEQHSSPHSHKPGEILVSHFHTKVSSSCIIEISGKRFPFNEQQHVRMKLSLWNDSTTSDKKLIQTDSKRD
jgi:hypothetical protein